MTRTTPALLTVAQYAKATGLHTETIRRRCRRGTLPAINVAEDPRKGRAVWRIPATALPHAA